MEAMEAQFKYYAFISYSHKDKKAADWIHKKLTFYRLPSFAREELQRDVRLRPICQDEHSLPPGPLWDMLKDKLDESRYLIVVCSPNSARPGLDGEHWVNREVEYFVSKHGAGRVIPVIVSGSPGDSANECFCPALKELEILALDMSKKEVSRRKVLTFLAAKLLGLDPDMLWSYDSHEKVRLVKRRIFWLSPLILLLVLVTAFIIDSSRLVVNYYADYVDSFGLPEGIYKLSADQLARRNIHYRFEYRGYRFGKSLHHDSADRSFFSVFGMQRVLRRVVQANSVGNPVTRAHTELGDRPAIQVFKYDSDISFYAKKLTAITHRNPGGKEGLIKKQLLFSDRGNVINGRVELRTPNNEPMRQKERMTLSKDDTDMTKWHSKILSQITGYNLERDKSGRVIKLVNIDAYGMPTADADGITGIELVPDDQGRTVEKWYLDNDGKRKPNRDLVAGQIYRYERENMVSAKYVGKNSEPVTGPHGWMICECEFDDDGNMVEERYLNSDGQPAIHAESGISGFVYEYERGNQIMRRAHNGKKGSARQWMSVMEYTDHSKSAKAPGYSSQHMEYNADGYIEKVTNRDLQGEICKSAFSKWAILKREYQGGKISEECYLDENGGPAVDGNGLHRVEIEYDLSSGEVSRYILYALKGSGGIWGNKDIHKVVRSFDTNGNISEERYYASSDDSAPAADSNGVFKVLYQYHSNGRYKRADLFAPPGAKVGIWGGRNAIHGVKLYNTAGQVVEQRCYASLDDSTPAADSNGIFKALYQYHSNGRDKRADFFAPPGAKVGIWGNKDVRKVVRLFDTNGNISEERYYASIDDSAPAADSNGVFKSLYQYHSNGRDKRADFFAPPGAKGGVWGGRNAIHGVKLYNTAGQVVEQRCYASLDESTPAADSNGIFKVLYQYHSNGNKKQIDSFAPPGAKGGVWGGKNAIHGVQLCNTAGKVVEQRCYASLDESIPAVDEAGRFKGTCQYYDNGNIKRRDGFALPGAGGIFGDADVRHSVDLFDEQGRIVVESFYASFDESIPAADRNGIFKIRHQYQSDGSKKRTDFFAPPGAKGGVWGGKDAIHGVRLLNAKGQIIEQRSYASLDDSKPAVNRIGVFRTICTYHSNGAKKQLEYFAPPGAKGGVSGNKNLVRIVLLHNKKEQIIELRNYASLDDSTPAADSNGVFRTIYTYHSNGTKKQLEYFAPPGAKGGVFTYKSAVRAVELYDETGSIISRKLYASMDDSRPI